MFLPEIKSAAWGTFSLSGFSDTSQLHYYDGLVVGETADVEVDARNVICSSKIAYLELQNVFQ